MTVKKPTLDAPMVWFGGKSRVASQVWERFGDVPNFVEPFFGSGAVLLGRPHEPKTETANDLDGYVCNAWRSIQHAPEKVAEYADQICHECDLHARHVWLRERRDELSRRLEGDPDYHDPKIAGWWLWGMACWIGGGFCGENATGPWQLWKDAEGVMQLRHLRNPKKSAGQGVKRQRCHLGDGQGVQKKHGGLFDWFTALQNRLRRVRFCCGDFERVLGPSVTFKHGMTGVFLDPPYGDDARRAKNLYGKDSGSVAGRAREWALDNGKNKLLRIALCGYEGEHDMPEGWECLEWSAQGGYGSQSKGENVNKHKERIWFSPHCLKPGDKT